MKTKFLLVILWGVFTCASAQVFVQKSFFKNTPELSGEVAINKSTLKVEGDDSYNIFEIDVPQTGYYYLNSWMMIPRLQDGTFMSYDVLINNTRSGLRTQATKDNWQNISITGNNNPIYLQSGINTIAFAAKIPEVPNIEFVKLARTQGNAMISEASYNKYIADIEQESETISSEKGTSTPPITNPEADYVCKLNMNLKYTWFKKSYLSVGSRVIVETEGVNDFSHIIYVFRDDTSKMQTQTWMAVSNNGTARIDIIIPELGFYYLLIRSLEPNKTGLVNFNIPTPWGLYTNCPATGTELQATQGTNVIYNTFTCCTTAGGDPMIWLVNGPDTSGTIVCYNDDYETFEPHDVKWGYNSRIKKKHTQSIYGAILSEYSSNAPTGGKTDLYVRCKNFTDISGCHCHLKPDDAMTSAPPSSAYNCIAYTGGITNKHVDPANPTSPYWVPGGTELDCFDKFYGSCRYVGGWKYTRQGANYANSGIDLFGSHINGGSGIKHASISKKADGMDHGYEFESKVNIGSARVFHSRHGMEGLYGQVVCHYISTGTYCLATLKEEDSLTFPIYLDESIANGWSVIENVEFTKEEKEQMASIVKSSLTISEIDYFEKLYATWEETWEGNAMYSIPREYAENKEYQELVRFCKNKGQAGWCLIFEKYGKGDFLSTTAMQELTLNDNPYNNELLQSILKENEDNQYTKDGRFIVRNFYSNGMLFIKKLLQNMKEENNPKSTPYEDDNKGIRYSNSDEFNVYPYSSSEIMIDFSLDRDAKISLVILDLQAKEVYTALNQRNLSHGSYQYVWNHTGNPSGVYLVRYVVNGTVNVKKVAIP